MNDIISADSTEYIGKFTYEKGKFRTYQFGSGYIEASSTSYTYRYYMKDHLGNNRVVTSLSGLIMQTNHYYPYGANLTCSTNQSRQQYKYNGNLAQCSHRLSACSPSGGKLKNEGDNNLELDRTHGLNWYDYIARQYDAELGQFTSMDDFCEKYYHISPYVYCGGNPISRVDPDGRDYRLIFDHENQTITIFANYKVGAGAEEVFNKAKDFWNSKSYDIGDYKVGFNITSDADENGHYMNTFNIGKPSISDSPSAQGIARYGKNIKLFSGRYNENTAKHEIGHTLGLIHYTNDDSMFDGTTCTDNLMYFNSAGKGERTADRRGTDIVPSQVRSIIEYGRKKNPNFEYSPEKEQEP